ncbi:MAG: diaminopimelate epimerase [bacterium]|nr:diaminopimelate epimerase [bacterium]
MKAIKRKLMVEINFTKMVGTGNDFVVVDNRDDGILEKDKSNLAKTLCLRRWSIGADGMLLIERSETGDFKMRVFNPDGGEAEMCGNGARCAARFAHLKFCKKQNISMETKAGPIKAQVKKDMISLSMPEPEQIRLNLNLKFREMTKEVSFINTGVPHVVFFTDNLDKVDVNKLGKEIRNYPEFSPHGTNVNFVQVISDNVIKVRTYERGVEDETLACGTGSVASAIISFLKKNLTAPVSVITKGGMLRVHFKEKDRKIYNVLLEGKASVVYEGIIQV